MTSLGWTGVGTIGALFALWFLLLARTAPQVRRSKRNRRTAALVFLVQTGAILTMVATLAALTLESLTWWQNLLIAAVSAGAVLTLRRCYTRLVVQPRHRQPMGGLLNRTGPHKAVVLPGQGVISHRFK